METLENNTLERVKIIVGKISNLLKDHTLSEIPTLTYNLRESGEDMIYFAKGTWNEKTKYLVPSPISKQKEYKKFFDEPMKGGISLPAYTVYIYEDRIEFLYKEKVNGEIIRKYISYL